MANKGNQVGLIIGGIAAGAMAAVTAAATVHDISKEKEARRELQKHKDLVEQKKQFMEHGSIKKYNPLVAEDIALLSFWSTFLTGYKNGNLALGREEIGANEVFTSTPVTKDLESGKDDRCKIHLQLKGTGQYLSGKKNGGVTLVDHCRTWEVWIVEKDEKAGTFSFKSIHDKYLCADKDDAAANRKRKGNWEKWKVCVVQSQQTEEGVPQPKK